MELMKLNIQLFAVSATLTASQGTQSITDNTSKVTLTWTLKRTSGTTNWNTPYYRDLTLTCDGQTYSENITFPTSISSKTITHTFTIKHNTDGSKKINYSSLLGDGNTSSFSDVSNSGSMSLSTIPRASSVTATNADIGSATSININRASNSFTHTLEYSFGSLTGIIASNIDTSYGWTIPTEFYEEIPNSKSGICTITCKTYNGSTLIGTSTTKLTITANEELSKPIVDGIVADMNMTTINLTGDATKLVKYFSNAQVDFSAEALNGASISKVTVNGVEATGTFVTFNKSSYETYEIIATDSRGYSSSKILTPEVIKYIPLTLNVEFFRTAPTTGEVSVSFSGNYFDDIFGWEENQLNLSWAYREKNTDEWISGGELIEGTHYVVQNNVFHSGLGNNEEDIILADIFDYRNAYDFIIYYSDKLISSSIQQSVTKGIPIINWDDDHFNVNGDITQNEEPFTSGGDALPVGTIVNYDGDEVPSGYERVAENEIIITSTNENPSDYLGGTWELVKKEFIELAETYTIGNEDCPFTQTSNVTSGSVFVIRNSQNIRVRLDIVNAVALSDTTVELGTFNWNALGITGTYASISGVVGCSDGANALIQYGINNNTGVTNTYDVVPKADGNTVAVGNTIYFPFDITIDSDHMLDEACDKFYWKRTS